MVWCLLQVAVCLTLITASAKSLPLNAAQINSTSLSNIDDNKKAVLCPPAPDGATNFLLPLHLYGIEIRGHYNLIEARICADGLDYYDQLIFHCHKDFDPFHAASSNLLSVPGYQGTIVFYFEDSEQIWADYFVMELEGRFDGRESVDAKVKVNIRFPGNKNPTATVNGTMSVL